MFLRVNPTNWLYERATAYRGRDDYGESSEGMNSEDELAVESALSTFCIWLWLHIDFPRGLLIHDVTSSFGDLMSDSMPPSRHRLASYQVGNLSCSQRRAYRHLDIISFRGWFPA